MKNLKKIKKRHKKILWVIGTRPNYMKVFKHPNQVILNTGQHYDYNMSGVFADKLKLPKIKYNLEAETFGQMVDGIMNVLDKERPDYVLVPGDTNSGLAGALAAAYCQIPVIHLEAGLRSFNRYMPEEINRTLIDKLSDIYLAPSETAIQNLINEGIAGNAWNVGSNMCDAVSREFPTKELKDYKKKTYRVLTLHRQETVDTKHRFKEVLKGIEKSGERLIWPIHPRAKKMIKAHGLKVPDNVEVIDPVDHKTMVNLISNSKQVVTDSGGIQVETYFLRIPCVTIRRETEWIETLTEGCNVLTGYDAKQITCHIKTFLPRHNVFGKNSYRNGDTNIVVKDILANL